jgi:hypothetical protein
VNTAESNDVDLVKRLAREAAATSLPRIPKSRNERGSNLELTISTLAKQLSRRAADPIEDRRSRQVARTEAYNAVRPVLAELADQHRRLSARGHWVALTSALVAAAVVAFIAIRIS